MNRLLTAACILTAGCFWSSVQATERLPQLAYATETEPRLEVAAIVHYLPDRSRALWRQALISPEEDLRRQTATTLIRLRTLAGDGFRDLEGELLEGFRTAVDQTVRHVMASALIHLNVRVAADDLFAFSQTGSRMAQQTVEPVLAEWQYQPIRSLWLERIQQPSGRTPGSLVLAIRGLAALNATEAIDDLTTFAANRSVRTEVRLAAADALGQLADDGLLQTADDLASDSADDRNIDRLIAARMLRRHTGDSAEQQMLKLAMDSRPAVATVALKLLLKVNAGRLHPHLDSLLSSEDPGVRRLTSQSLMTDANVDAVRRLAGLLTDLHPDVRISARESLKQLAPKGELRQEILNQIERLLSEEDWRGLEQAARLAGELDHEPAAHQLVSLLESERMEVQITAAWALRELTVEETLSPIHEVTKKLSHRFFNDVLLDSYQSMNQREDTCLAFLMEALGKGQFKPATPLLARYVPKRLDLGPKSRSAAIWALGHIHSNTTPPEQLVSLFIERMVDDEPVSPEYPEVRTAAAISLGRMKTTEALKSIRLILAGAPPYSRRWGSCLWAESQITGEPLSIPAPFRVRLGASFLRPLARDQAKTGG